MDFDFLFRTATSVYGQTELVGASWDLFPWFVGAAILFIVLDILRFVLVGRRASAGGKAAASPGAGTVVRHKGADRLYHWLMAAAVLTLMFTAFAPILGWKFEWDTAHWISGVVLAVLVLYHIVRASIWQDFWAMMIVPADLSEGAQGLASLFGGKGGPAKSGKYDLAQKLYHWAIAALVLALVGTGLLMLAKIDTSFWQRNPYFLTDTTWGIVYAIHGLCAMAAIALVIIHIYFAVRPDKLWLTRSMLTGRIARQDYATHFDPQRWKV
jgi:cytochrome b subunit of formate dehydrogenase